MSFQCSSCGSREVECAKCANPFSLDDLFQDIDFAAIATHIVDSIEDIITARAAEQHIENITQMLKETFTSNQEPR